MANTVSVFPNSAIIEKFEVEVEMIEHPKSLAEALDLARLDIKKSCSFDINEDNFPLAKLPVHGKRIYYLVSFGQAVTYDEVMRVFNRLKIQPCCAHNALLFASVYPNVQRKHVFVAPGQLCKTQYCDYQRMLQFTGDSVSRFLFLCANNEVFDKCYYFLGYEQEE